MEQLLLLLKNIQILFAGRDAHLGGSTEVWHLAKGGNLRSARLAKSNLMTTFTVITVVVSAIGITIFRALHK